MAHSPSCALGGVAESIYLDNLELVETLIQLRQGLETSALWDSASILITSDHPFRRELWTDFFHENIARLLETVDNPQVPFILKLADQRLPTVYGNAFNLVLVPDLSLALCAAKSRQQLNSFDGWTATGSDFPPDSFSASLSFLPEVRKPSFFLGTYSDKSAIRYAQ